MSRSSKVNRGDYLRWLIAIIGDSWKDKSYLLLLKELYNIPFYWSVSNDDNRAFDGLALREEYFGNINGEQEASILEVLIGIAQHMDDNMFDHDEGERVDVWFWELITNLELHGMDDNSFYDINSEEIHGIITIWLDRSYKKNGDRGIFPLKDAENDQRKVEIWYQMAAYLLEKDMFS